MVDWISAKIPCYLPEPITGGMIIDHDEYGEIRWTTQKRLPVEGSYSSKITVRAVSCEELEISGNPAKFLHGHNIYGSSDLRSIVCALLEKIMLPIFGHVPSVYVDDAILTRVDVTDGFIMDREGDVMAYLRAIEQTANIAYKGRGVLEGSTLVFGRSNHGDRAKDWQLVLYAKGKEVEKRPLPEPMSSDTEVVEWVKRLLRAEVRLRSRELKKLGVQRLGDWSSDTAHKLWEEKMSKLELSEVRQVDTAELEELKPRIRNAYAAWRHGEDLRKGASKASFYRLRREMIDALGIDISVPMPKSNVVPLVRVIEATPAHRPPWADRIDRMLAA